MSNMFGLNWSVSSHEISESGHGGDRGTSIRASSLNQGCEGELNSLIDQL